MRTLSYDMDKKRYGKSGHPKTLKSKSAWAKLGRTIKPNEEAKASAILKLPHGEVEYDLFHVSQTWD